MPHAAFVLVRVQGWCTPRAHRFDPGIDWPTDLECAFQLNASLTSYDGKRLLPAITQRLLPLTWIPLATHHPQGVHHLPAPSQSVMSYRASGPISAGKAASKAAGILLSCVAVWLSRPVTREGRMRGLPGWLEMGVREIRVSPCSTLSCNISPTPRVEHGGRNVTGRTLCVRTRSTGTLPFGAPVQGVDARSARVQGVAWHERQRRDATLRKQVLLGCCLASRGGAEFCG